MVPSATAMWFTVICECYIMYRAKASDERVEELVQSINITTSCDGSERSRM